MVKLIVLAAIVCGVSAIVPKYKNCGPPGTVQFVDMGNCDSEPCRFMSGYGPYILRAVIRFDRKAQFVRHKQMFKEYNAENIELPESDICKLIECPIKAGQERCIDLEIPIDKKLPQMDTVVYHKGYNEKGELLYCFSFHMDIIHSDQVEAVTKVKKSKKT